MHQREHLMKQKPTEPLQEYIRMKDENQEQYARKKVSQKQAKQRRQFIRELKEDREYS